VAARVTPPAGGPAPAARTEPVARRLDPETYGRLLPLARSARLTRPQVVLAALDAALADLGGHFPRATTMVVAGRPRAHVQGAVGWFASQVAVVDPARHAASATAPARHAGPATARARRADPRERLSAFRAVVTAALDAARIPWPLAVADAVPALFSRPLSLPYLSFNAQPLRMRTALAPLPFAGTEVSEVPINLGRQEGALLSYWVEEDDGGLRASLRYKPGVYDEADVAALWTATAGHLAAFLRSAGR
ncbi:MAG TPA: hypothetical protein VFV66_02370, partial [Nonomuraea sp.]|nr:hypothetical protein [Nonomuraea sp.]